MDNVRIQDSLDFSPALRKSPLWPWVPYYELPYHVAKPKRVLILGAGTGNEVVFALRHGAQQVHAVEIDPVIAGFGTTLHPNRPYTSDGVEIIVNDARSYIANSSNRYDLILMSALDSHKQLAGMSSLRLESFVYTVESFRQMRDLLAPAGVFCLNLSCGRPWIGERTYWTLTEAFGERPIIMTSPKSPFKSLAYLYAPPGSFQRDLLPQGFEMSTFSEETLRKKYPSTEGVLLATDDWSYLYLESNKIPALYLVVLGVLMVASSGIVVRVAPAVRTPSFHFFLLGAGFMLLETRSITQMALLFGATWNINAIVFASVLLMILLANYLVAKGWTPRIGITYALLLATLLLGYGFPFDRLLGLSLLPRLMASIAVVGIPILWASMIFSRSFKDVTDMNGAFGSNLLGGVQS